MNKSSSEESKHGKSTDLLRIIIKIMLKIILNILSKNLVLNNNNLKIPSMNKAFKIIC